MKVYRGLGLKQSTVSSMCCREMNACKKKKKKKENLQWSLHYHQLIGFSLHLSEWLLSAQRGTVASELTLHWSSPNVVRLKGQLVPKSRRPFIFFVPLPADLFIHLGRSDVSRWVCDISPPWRWNGTRQRFGPVPLEEGTFRNTETATSFCLPEIMTRLLEIIFLAKQHCVAAQ